MSVSYSTISLKKGRMLWHSLESQTSITSNTFRLQTSLIITACCFVISFHILVSSARNFVLSSRSTLPLVREFMDEMDLMSRSMVALNWARMENRADKSRSIVIKKGRTLNVNPFYTCNLLEISHVSDSSNHTIYSLNFLAG